MRIRATTLARVGAVLLTTLSLAGAWAQADVRVEHAFAESIAERMGLESTRCDPQLVGLMRARDGSVLCYQHGFDDFEAFRSAWDAAAEWEDVFAAHAAQIAERRASGAELVDGWWSMTEEMRQAGIESGFDTYLKPYVLRASGWGFDGTIEVSVDVGRNALGEVNAVVLLFEPGR